MHPGKHWRQAGLCGSLLLLGGCAGLRPGGGTRSGQDAARASDEAGWLGSPARRLTDSSADQLAPSFSPDGLSLVYQNNGDGNWELYQLSLSEGRPQRLTDTAEAEEDPSWSPDGRWIVCTVHAPTLDADPPRDILLMSPDGKNRHVVAAHGADDWSPRFAPDSRSIYFVSDRLDQAQGQRDEQRQTAVFRYLLETDSLAQVTEAGRVSSPIPAGERLGLRQDDHHLAWLEATGPQTVLEDSSQVLGQPDWQATAGWAVMAFSAEQDGRVLVRAPGAADWTPVNRAEREADWLPAWTPDGRGLAWSGRTSGQWDLYLLSH